MRRRRRVDNITVLRALDGLLLTKRIQRARDGEFLVAGYDRAFEFAVTEHPVTSLIGLGGLLASLESCPTACVIRGRPLPGTNLQRTWRLLYETTDEDGRTREATFEPAARRWIALDFDDLPTPEWNEDDLARRRQAILDDYARRNTPDAAGLVPPYEGAAILEDEAEAAVWDIDIAGDADPAPIDPVTDWALVCRHAVSTLPTEFHPASCWWQMTSSAGIKPGIRLRLWFWLDRPVTDQECKRWLADAPVDRSLYSAVQVHYVARPIFADPADDPVPLRCGWWWRHQNTVAVPDLPEPQPIDPEQAVGTRWRDAAPGPDRRAHAYADAALRAVSTAPAGTRHPTLMAVATRLYSLCDAGLLDPRETTRQLLAAAAAPLSAVERQQRCTPHGGRPSENEQACDWARAKARAAPDLPEGFGR